MELKPELELAAVPQKAELDPMDDFLSDLLLELRVTMCASFVPEVGMAYEEACLAFDVVSAQSGAWQTRWIKS